MKVKERTFCCRSCSGFASVKHQMGCLAEKVDEALETVSDDGSGKGFAVFKMGNTTYRILDRSDELREFRRRLINPWRFWG